MKNEFSIRLKKALDDKRISASELSRLSGVNKVAISNYLNGKYLAKQDNVYLLAKALDVDPGWLMTGVEPSSWEDEYRIKHREMYGEAESETPITSEARILAKGIDKLPKEQREQALNVIKAMFAKYSNYFEKENDDEP